MFFPRGAVRSARHELRIVLKPIAMASCRGKTWPITERRMAILTYRVEPRVLSLEIGLPSQDTTF